MDPIAITGLVAAGAAFVELAYKVLKTLSRFIVDITAVPRQAVQLQYEISSLVGVITALKLTLTMTPSIILATEEASLSDSVRSSVVVLEEMLEKLERRTETSQRTGFQRLIWPLKTKDMDQYIDRIQRYKGTVSLVMQIGATYEIYYPGTLT